MDPDPPFLVHALDMGPIEKKIAEHYGVTADTFLKECGMTTGGGVSLKPSEAQAGGGYLDDVDVIIKRAYFRLWDYNGTIPNPVLGLAIQFAMLDGSGEAEQVYSGGDTKFLVPSPDGKRAVPVSPDRTGLMDGTNALVFLMSLINSGFPEHLVGDDVSVFDGVQAHVNRVPAPKRPGMKPQPVVPGEPAKKNDILVVTKIHNLPQIIAGTYQTAQAPVAVQAAAPAVAGAGKTKKASPVPAAAAVAQAPVTGAAPMAGDPAIQTRAAEVLMQVILEHGGSIAKVQVANEVFKILNAAKDPLRNQVSTLVFKDDFLSMPGQGWVYDGTTISLG